MLMTGIDSDQEQEVKSYHKHFVRPCLQINNDLIKTIEEEHT